jgi:hypothetical protein
MSAREDISFLHVKKGSLPDEVRKRMLEQVCKIPVGQMEIQFQEDLLSCVILIQIDSYYVLGPLSKGRLGVITIYRYDNEVFSGMFLADVAKVQGKPPEKGALLIPLY